MQLMSTPGGMPTHPLTPLALTIGDALDAGWDLADLRDAVLARCPAESSARDVLTDVVLAAHALLCGLDPAGVGLGLVWSAPTLDTRGRARHRPRASSLRKELKSLVGPAARALTVRTRHPVCRITGPTGSRVPKPMEKNPCPISWRWTSRSASTTPSRRPSSADSGGWSPRANTPPRPSQRPAASVCMTFEALDRQVVLVESAIEELIPDPAVAAALMTEYAVRDAELIHNRGDSPLGFDCAVCSGRYGNRAHPCPNRRSRRLAPPPCGRHLTVPAAAVCPTSGMKRQGSARA